LKSAVLYLAGITAAELVTALVNPLGGIGLHLLAVGAGSPCFTQCAAPQAQALSRPGSGTPAPGLESVPAAGQTAPDLLVHRYCCASAGSYGVTIDGLSGSFAVVAPPPPPPPAPTAFSLSALSIQPTEVQPKEAVTLTVSVANTSGTEGSYTVVLKINGVKEAEKRVTIGAGESQDVTFSVTKAEAASYTVVVDGLSGTFVVVAPAPHPVPPPINWPVLGGVIVVVVAVIVFLIVILVRRRKYA